MEIVPSLLSGERADNSPAAAAHRMLLDRKPVQVEGKSSVQNIHPLAWVLDIFPSMPPIQLKCSESMVPLAAARVTGRAHENWYRSGSIVDSIMDACIMADSLAELGADIVTTECACSEADAKVIHHACDGCGILHLCNELLPLSPDSLSRTCTLCRDAYSMKMHKIRKKPEKGKKQKKKKPKQVNVERELLGLRAFPPLITQEVKLLMSEATRSKELVDQKTQLRASLRESPRDLYLDLPLEPDAELKTLGKDQFSVFGMELDAILPICWYNGRVRIHVAGNVGFTRSYVNRMAWIQPKLVLRLIHDIATCPPEDSDHLAELIARLDQLFLVRCEIPYERLGRLNLDMTEEEANQFISRCYHGISDTSKLKHNKVWRYKHNVLRAYSKPKDSAAHESALPDLHQVQHVLEEAQTAKFRLPVINGVPYPFAGGPQDLNWSWSILYRMLTGYLRVITTMCNCRWKTDLSIPVLVIILHWTVLNQDDPYWRDLFSLPLCQWRKHAVRITQNT